MLHATYTLRPWMIAFILHRLRIVECRLSQLIVYFIRLCNKNKCEFSLGMPNKVTGDCPNVLALIAIMTFCRGIIKWNPYNSGEYTSYTHMKMMVVGSIHFSLDVFCKFSLLEFEWRNIMHNVLNLLLFAFFVGKNWW